MSTAALEVDFTDEQVMNDAKKKVLADGWYRFIISGPEVTTSKSNHIMIKCPCAPLQNTKDANSAFWTKIYHNVILPLRNKAVPGHKAPDTMGLCSQFFGAVLEDKWPQFPEWVNGTLTWKGQELDSVIEDDTRNEVTRSRYNLLTKIASSDPHDPEYGVVSLLDKNVFYAEVITNQGYKNLSKIKLELPQGAVLVSKEKFLG